MVNKHVATVAAAGLLIMLIAATLTGCNSATRNLGGTQIIQLEPGQKLNNVTWKDSDLWILTRAMKAGGSAEDWTFKESSNLGIMEGTVIIKETDATDDKGDESNE